jgi:hypothetical protein
MHVLNVDSSGRSVGTAMQAVAVVHVPHSPAPESHYEPHHSQPGAKSIDDPIHSNLGPYLGQENFFPTVLTVVQVW